MKASVLVCSATLTILGWAGAHALAQTRDAYPSRALRLIVPNVPGGASDFVARIIQPHWAEQFGQSVVVDNRGGAAGNIALETVARATPDGYTLMIGSNTQAINPSIYPKFPYTPLQHLQPLTQVADVPGSLVVHPSLPARSVKELIAHAQAHPGKLNYGSPSPSSANRLAMEIFMRHTGTKMVHVPYKGGSGQMLVALMANEVNVAFATFSSTVNFVKADRLRMLGVIAPERLAAMPDVPTMPELGFRDMKTGSWFGIFVPKGTPLPVTKKVFDVATKTMEHPDVLKRFAIAGTRAVVSRSPEEFRQFVKSETDTYAAVVKAAGITAD
ncbi:MAG TPA: tripartite tricarboxylate transporter substrate binding protein [Burkholderiales bacterium]|nr:tripartite tricarboxylate transporter substrate binding protein [Burkholderiales bacterium]